MRRLLRIAVIAAMHAQRTKGQAACICLPFCRQGRRKRKQVSRPLGILMLVLGLAPNWMVSVINAAVTRGMGSPVYDLTGSVEAVDAAAPADLAKTEFSREHLAQYWLDGQDLRMVLYRERGPEAPHGYAELTIRARADEEDGYSGDWELSIFDGTGDQPEGKSWMFGGKANCTVE